MKPLRIVLMFGLAAAGAVVWWYPRGESASEPETVTGPGQRAWVPVEGEQGKSPAMPAHPPAAPLPDQQMEEQMIPDPGRAEQAPNAGAAGGGPTWDVREDGGVVTLRMALDEVVLRDGDGLERVVPLDPPATTDTLAARIRRMGPQAGVFPVAYVEGRERSAASRRLITEELRVRVGDVDVQAITDALDLSLKDRPAYAPEWAILSAPDAFAALAAMTDLREMPGVVEADVLLARQVARRALPNDPLIGDQWHLANPDSSRTHVNVETVWDYAGGAGQRGRGVRIGIVDDGMQTDHPDLAQNVDTVNDKDWNGNDNDPSPGSLDDHGTSCAGNAGARGNNNLGVSGTAPESTLVGLRLIAGSITDWQEAEAMSYRNDIIPIKSNSWGPYDDGESLEAPGPLTAAALESAASSGRNGRGTIFMWAGGNGGDVEDNSNYDGYANSIYTISVGASDSGGGRAYYSEPGSNVVICAPSSGLATGITTVDRTGSDGYSSGDYTDDFGGTSSATPTAAGIVALMLEANPDLGWRDVQEVLIRSAYQLRPSDSGWATNGAGFHFHHEFGAGLVDATAAVNLSRNWTNLTTQRSEVYTQSGLSVPIPNQNAAGITRTFDVSGSNIRVEHVTLKVNVSHTARGNLEITLTSPSGMVSRLAEVRGDTNNNYTDWTFSSVRHWGESSTGNWSLQIADLSSSGNSTGGTLTGAELTVYGTPDTPVNPGPVVAISSPNNGQVFSPGATVTVAVDASDLDIQGAPGTVSKVSLFADGNAIGTDTSAPYQFSWAPANGTYVLTATATDAEGETGSSFPVTIHVVNQPPTVTDVTLNATQQRYADEILAVSSVSAQDPEGQTPVMAYQWQYSTDGVGFSDEGGAVQASLPVAAGNAGKLWRCSVTASDGEATSDPLLSEAVNVLTRPITSVNAGDAYSHTSGLVLRGTETTLSRPAIINEFSQGPSGENAEWIEILTLQETSLAFWDLQDEDGNMLLFLDDAIWDDIPAGTLIVIYNGANKDPLLPADNGDAADGVLVISSTDDTYFDASFDDWVALGNGGDAIFLTDAEIEEVHSLAYGDSSAASPHLGSVGSGRAAHYTGDTDDGADVATNWTLTPSGTARREKALLPGVGLSGGLYAQNFDATPGADGTAYPPGWTAFNGSTEDTVMATGTETSTAGANYNYGSRIGILGSGSNFNEGSLVLALQNTSGASGLTISYNITKIREQGRSHFWNLEYSLTSPTSGFTPVSGGQYVSGTLPQGTVTSYASIPLPAALENQSGTVYLRWHYTQASGSGARDALALDDVVIQSEGGDPFLSVSIAPSVFSESAGATAAVGTVSVAEAPAANLTVMLQSSNTNEATVPASVVIPAGETGTTFAVDAVDDAIVDGSQTVTVTASAPGYLNGLFPISVGDDETPVEGVTPGAGNSVANADFVTALRNGLLNVPALFRIGAAANVPTGLTLDETTGVLSGTIDPSVPAGTYLIVIERYNSLGEVRSESFDLEIGAGASIAYAAWISGYPVGANTGMEADPDGDGIRNAVENILGTSPAVGSAGLAEVSGTPATLVFRHTLSNTPAGDLSWAYRWSKDLTHWHGSGETHAGTTVILQSQILTDREAPGLDEIETTATLSGPGPVFVLIQVTP